MAALKGSPWQICTDNVKWKDFPLGKVPGQSDDPSCLLLDSYSTMSVLEQPVDVERTVLRSAAPRPLCGWGAAPVPSGIEIDCAVGLNELL
ncbi:UNVERIFIED_CONTAM: hypothetical protein FKN15_012615 [Acipenser sinensis]